MKNMFLMKKWNSACKNAVEIQIMINLWKLEDQYTIIFLLALFPEEPREIHFFEKSVEHVGLDFQKMFENWWKWVWMGPPWVPTGLIFDEDGAKSCPMPLDALPTPFKAVLKPFWSILGRKGVDKICRIFFPIYPFFGELPIYRPWWKLC